MLKNVRVAGVKSVLRSDRPPLDFHQIFIRRSHGYCGAYPFCCGPSGSCGTQEGGWCNALLALSTGELKILLQSMRDDISIETRENLFDDNDKCLCVLLVFGHIGTVKLIHSQGSIILSHAFSRMESKGPLRNLSTNSGWKTIRTYS